jgi:hypothetical protein
MGIIEWIALGVVIAGAFFVLGITVGYRWRDRISRARRMVHLVERDRRHAELYGVEAVLAARKRAIGSGEQVAKPTGKYGKLRKKPTKPKFKVVTGGVPQKAGPDRTSTVR